jgi:hypothetical protein
MIELFINLFIFKKMQLLNILIFVAHMEDETGYVADVHIVQITIVAVATTIMTTIMIDKRFLKGMLTDSKK